MPSDTSVDEALDRVDLLEERVAALTRELENHRAALAEFRKEMGARHPALKVETYLMSVNGRVEMLM